MSFFEKLVPDTWPEVIFWSIVLFVVVSVADELYFQEVDLYSTIWGHLDRLFFWLQSFVK